VTQHPIERRYRRLAVGANRKAERLKTPGRITDRDLFAAYEASDGCCEYCGIDVDPLENSFDHVIPFDKGGENTPANIKICCMTCQREKFTKTPDEYEQWKELVRVCPVDGKRFRPRWADHVRGYGKYCSRKCSGAIGGASRG